MIVFTTELKICLYGYHDKWYITRSDAWKGRTNTSRNKIFFTQDRTVDFLSRIKNSNE
jgi:hypothetical protein